MLRKLDDSEEFYCQRYKNEYCTSPEHEPPRYNESLKPGIYVYSCPICDLTTVFVVKD